MHQIKLIQINNFKFFPESQPIEVEGKNVLLYGENGSGKSSLYWALYTLLECANKSDIFEIQKYFNKNNSSSLVNIYSQVGADGVGTSFIRIILNNDISIEVSHTNTSINSNQDAKISNYASDFLNYRLLQRTHNAKHNDEIDLFPIFEDAVFNYIQFTPINWRDTTGQAIQIVSAGEIWKLIKEGPPQNYPRRNGNNDSYPLSTRHIAAYQNFKVVVDSFHNSLVRLIASINSRASIILQQKLGYKITFHLELEKLAEFKTTEKTYQQPKYKIKLIIDDFNGQGAVIKKPQSFLNEAKLSAIALSIRLVILEQRVQEAVIKMLVLDDLLVSLDMSNRDKVTKLFLNEYAWYYDDIANKDIGHQTFILTHDRSYFTFTKHEIENLIEEKRKTWKIIEMYTDDPDPSNPTDFEKPRIFYNESDLAIALKHFKAHDYPAAANYMRKHAESLLCRWLPEFCWKDAEKKDQSHFKIALHNILDNGIAFLILFGEEATYYKELKKYVRVLLNPLSHADVGVERYKEEIKQVDEILKKIEIFHKESSWNTLIAGGEVIQIRIPNTSSNQVYTTQYELSTSLYSLIINGVQNSSTFRGKATKCFPINADGTIPQEWILKGNDKEMHDNYQEFCRRHSFTEDTDWKKYLYKIDGTPIITHI